MAFVQVKTLLPGASVTTHALTFDTNVTAGNTIVLGLGSLVNHADPTSVTDSQGNTYTLLLVFVDTGSRKAWQYRAVNAVGGACTVTTVFPLNTVATHALLELSNGDAVSSTTSQISTSQVHQVANLTNVQAVATFVGVTCMNVQPPDAVAADGYTARASLGPLYVQTKSVTASETNDGSFTTVGFRRTSNTLAVYEGAVTPPVTAVARSQTYVWGPL